MPASWKKPNTSSAPRALMDACHAPNTESRLRVARPSRAISIKWSRSFGRRAETDRLVELIFPFHPRPSLVIRFHGHIRTRIGRFTTRIFLGKHHLHRRE